MYAFSHIHFNIALRFTAMKIARSRQNGITEIACREQEDGFKRVSER